MENKKVGWLIEGIAMAMLIIVIIFHKSTEELALQSCPHAYECTMTTAMNSQYLVSLAVVGIIVAIGLYIMFSKPQEKIIEKEIKVHVETKPKKLNLKGLDPKEKKVIELIKAEGGVLFQAELKEKLEIGKVGMTRLLDKLESKELIERKRRGMNNIVVLKQ